MMAQKHLHELLKEDQEPFLLKKYISDRCSQMKRPFPKSSMQVKKQRQMHQNSNFPVNFCKHACFFSLPDTPDLRKSPLFPLPSPAKSPAASTNPIFLQIPARTAALLLEAALRIQKQSSAPLKSKPQHKSNAFGLFGSLFKRLTQRSRDRKREINHDGADAPVKEMLAWVSSTGCGELPNGFSEQDSQDVNNKSDMSACEVAFICSCNGRPGSAVWSESNEDKSLVMETSISSQWEEFEDFAFLSKQNNITECACYDNGALCESPFRFVLLRSPSPASGTPELASPASSPSRRTTQGKENNGAERVDQCQSGEEAEEKEQCSPVSVLDPPSDDDDEAHENNEECEEEEDDGFDLENSYAIVQRAKEQLLEKLRRFEKLAELDPLEPEKGLFDQEEDDDETLLEGCEWDDGNEETLDKENGCNELVLEVMKESSLGERGGLKRLICDLLREEGEVDGEERERVMKRMCKKLELWREVEANTIDMMVQQDLSREEGEWKMNNNGEYLRQVAGDLEHVIFGFLVEEVYEELEC